MTDPPAPPLSAPHNPLWTGNRFYHPQPCSCSWCEGWRAGKAQAAESRPPRIADPAERLTWKAIVVAQDEARTQGRQDALLDTVRDLREWAEERRAANDFDVHITTIIKCAERIKAKGSERDEGRKAK